MADAIAPPIISLNLASKQFRTCVRNNTVNRKHLEYFLDSPTVTVGGSRCGLRAPGEF